ncbi:MAG: hypothetical protein ACRD3E_01565, partial [Terriglobales bacterium]
MRRELASAITYFDRALATARYFGLLATIAVMNYLAFLVTLGFGGYFASLASQGIAKLSESLSRDPRPFRAKRAACCALLCLVATTKAVAAPAPQ